jgi:hypothetical protein
VVDHDRTVEHGVRRGWGNDDPGDAGGDDGSSGREVVSGRAGWGGDNDAVGGLAVTPRLAARPRMVVTGSAELRRGYRTIPRVRISTPFCFSAGPCCRLSPRPPNGAVIGELRPLRRPAWMSDRWLFRECSGAPMRGAQLLAGPDGCWSSRLTAFGPVSVGGSFRGRQGVVAPWEVDLLGSRCQRTRAGCGPSRPSRSDGPPDVSSRWGSEALPTRRRPLRSARLRVR